MELTAGNSLERGNRLQVQGPTYSTDGNLPGDLHGRERGIGGRGGSGRNGSPVDGANAGGAASASGSSPAEAAAREEAAAAPGAGKARQCAAPLHRCGLSCSRPLSADVLHGRPRALLEFSDSNTTVCGRVNVHSYAIMWWKLGLKPAAARPP